MSTDVSVSPTVLFLPPIKSAAVISVSEVHRQGCTTECFRFPHIVVCRCAAAFHVCYSYRKIPRLNLDQSRQQSIVVRERAEMLAISGH